MKSRPHARSTSWRSKRIMSLAQKNTSLRNATLSADQEICLELCHTREWLFMPDSSTTTSYKRGNIPFKPMRSIATWHNSSLSLSVCTSTFQFKDNATNRINLYALHQRKCSCSTVLLGNLFIKLQVGITWGGRNLSATELMSLARHRGARAAFLTDARKSMRSWPCCLVREPFTTTRCGARNANAIHAITCSQLPWEEDKGSMQCLIATHIAVIQQKSSY